MASAFLFATCGAYSPNRGNCFKSALAPTQYGKRRFPSRGHRRFSANGATGPAMCDPGYGPIPELLGLAEVTGDRYAVGRWHCTFYVVDGPQLFLEPLADDLRHW